MITLGIFMQVDKYATEGYSYRIEPAYADGTYWCWNDLNHTTSEFKLIKEISIDPMQESFWLIQNGLQMVEEEQANIEASYTQAMANVADLKSKYIMLAAPSEDIPF
jgi:hypothetical protein